MSIDDPITLEFLRRHSGLPGPRGNLALLYRFAADCDPVIVAQCLAVIRDDTANSPDEFVGMCGVLGYVLLNWQQQEMLIGHLRNYSQHRSWRIREAVAIAIQEIPVASLEARLQITTKLETADPLVHRALVAGLCEPKNLAQQAAITGVYAQLRRSTAMLRHERRLTEGEEALRKALGYAWSVAVVAAPALGKPAFEELLQWPERHVRWIVAENLKKKRLEQLDHAWVAACKAQLAVSSK